MGILYGFPGTTRPNMKLTVDALGCYGDRTPVTVVVTNFPQLDAAVTDIIEPIGFVTAGVNTAVKAVIKNFGQVALTSVDIPYSINGVVMDTVTWTGNLAYTQVDTFLLDSVVFPGGIVDLVVYSVLPNDTFYTNDSASVNFLACLSGTYSIGDTTTGAFAYGSFNGAVAALNSAGICSSVVFNVEAGIYNEKVVIEEIIGAGPNATITFQSASGDSTDVILVDSATVSAAKYTVKLDGADYITFQKMTIKALGASYGHPVEMESNADNNTIANCELIMNLSTSSNLSAIYAMGDNKNITVKNNYIQNGGYSVYISGPSSSNPSTGLLVHGNIIEDAGNFGLYIKYQDSCIITNNTISMGANSYYAYGIYINYCNHNYEVGNNIINVFKGIAGGMKHGLFVKGCNYYSYVGSGSILGGTGLVYNNSINIIAGTGIKYGIYSNNNDDVKFLYNTVKLSGACNNARALYQINTTQSTIGEVFINNSFIDSIGKYAAFFSEPSTVSISDYNNFYSEGGNIAYWGGVRTTLVDLQTASAKDAHSISVNPTFVAADDLHLAYYSHSGKATPDSNVTTDVDGKLRSATLPTIGFHEKSLLTINIGVTEVINFPDTTLQAALLPIVAKVHNFGLDTVYTFAVEYTVNNGTAVSTIFSDTLAPNTDELVTLPTLTTPAGPGTFCAYTVLATDPDVNNDSVCYNFYAIPTKDAVMLSIVSIDDACDMADDTIHVVVTNIGIDTINAVGQSVPTYVSYQVNGGTVVTETFTPVVAPNDTATYTFATLANFATNSSVDSVFHIVSWLDLYDDFVQSNDTTTFDVLSLHVPLSPIVVTPVSILYATSANLSATSPSNDLLSWYRYYNSTTSLDTGMAYTTTYLYATDSFFVAASSIGSSADVFIGTGTKTNTHLPMEMYYGYTYSQSIYYPSDFTETGTISKISYYYNGSGSYNDDIVIYMGTTTQNTFSSTSDWVGSADLTTVYTGTFTTTGVSGWVEIELDVPFFYDGSDNLVIAFDENTPGYHASADGLLGTDMGVNRSIYFYNDSSNPDPMSPPTSGNYLAVSTKIANVKLLVTPQGCSSAKSKVDVIVTTQPANDVGVITIDNPFTGIFKSSNEDVTVQLVNFGSADQSNIPMKYTINGGPVVVDSYTSTLVSGDTVTFTFAQTADLSGVDSIYNFEVYTDLANDVTHANDTAKTIAEHEYPAYCISKASFTTNSEISNVVIGNSFSNASAISNAVYTNFTQTVAAVNLQAGYAIAVDITTSFSPPNSFNSAGYIKIYIDYNRDGDFNGANEEVFGLISLSNGNTIGNFNVPYSVTPGITSMRIVHKIYGSSSNVSPCGIYNYGETEDYLVNILPRIPNDAGVLEITNPVGLSSSSNTSINVDVMNFGTDTIFSLDVSYVLNGGTPVTMTYATSPIAPLDVVSLNLGAIMLNDGSNSICAYTTLTNDSINLNDTMCTSTYSQATVTLSYNDDFEGP
ncbi:MAG: right-handed parallel beta-helix repeat-containing protein, partial [Chlamydiia bacterium]|nr:right-handed parallel beta-helix repeat-containing protein [Chlamydiia bacterium]